MGNIELISAAVKDKAGKKYWDNEWSVVDAPAAVDPSGPGPRNLFARRMHELFRSIFEKYETAGKKFIELGCGSSIWLAYFSKEFGFEVSGLDYSEIGCEQERKILANAGVQGDIVHGDFFDPPPHLREKYDFVYSSGVAEHFVPTETCLAAFADFMKPDGVMITIVPNLTGVLGRLVKLTNKPVYDIHVPLDAETLRKAHISAGLEVVSCDYFLSSGFGVANVSGLPPDRTSTKIKKALLKSLERMSVITWMIEERTFKLPNSRLFSPYIVCIAVKPK